MTTRAHAGTVQALRRGFRKAPALVRGLWLTIVLAIVGTGMQIVVPVVVQQIIDKDLLGPGGVDVSGAAGKGLIAAVGIVVASLALRMAIIRLNVASSTGLSDLRVMTFSHLHRRSVLHLAEERRGALVSRVTSDVEAIQEFMEWGGTAMIIGLAQLLLALVVMFFYEWRLALLVLVGVAVYAAMLSWFQRILQRSFDRVRQVAATTMGTLAESISGLATVRAQGAEDQMQRRLDEALDHQVAVEHRTNKLGAALFSSAELFAGLLTAAVVAAGVLLGADAGMTAGKLVAFLFLVNLLVEPVQGLVETLESAEKAGAGLRRVLDELDRPVDLADPVTGPAPAPGPLTVEARGVSFRYPDGTEAVRDVSVSIERGSRVAVVGETGSGKTTFAKLVARLMDPAAGEITLSGVPLPAIPFRELRRRVAFVPQEGFLFAGTIADNIRYGRPDASDADIEATFAELGLAEWVAGLDAGIHTEVGERGSGLSAGERQLVALARAWIVAPDLLILDEATSAVDPALDVRLRQAVDRLTSGRTSITVAHRLATAEVSDLVLVFDGGRLVQRGTHADLVLATGPYRDLHRDWVSATGA